MIILEDAGVAQLVEQRFRKPQVARSIRVAGSMRGRGRVVYRMPRELVLTRQLVIILSVWLCVCGMAAVDLFDLADELLQPSINFSQVSEPEIELDDEGSLSTVAVLAGLYLSRAEGAVGYVSALASPPAVSPRPLYEQLVQYRI